MINTPSDTALGFRRRADAIIDKIRDNPDRTAAYVILLEALIDTHLAAKDAERARYEAERRRPFSLLRPRHD